MSVSAGIALSIRLLVLSATIRHALADREERFTSVTSTWTLTITVFPTAVDSPTASIPIAASISTSAPNMSSSSFQDEVLNSTNYYRKQFQVEPVTWNDTLADFADDYVKGCIWKHSGGPYGENLASGYETTALAIDAWGDEEHLYNWAKQKFSEGAGHFTQLVWSNTTTVGCGVVNCTEEGKGNVQGRYLICEYWPRGNVQTQFGYNVRKPGTAKDGTPGFGGAGRSVEVKGVVAALAAVTILLAVVA